MVAAGPARRVAYPSDLFDVSILSGTAILADQRGYAGSLAAILASVVIGAVLLIRRRRIEPAVVS